MKFKSTRNKAPLLDFSEALFAGLAPDGGLYVPEEFPTVDLKKLSAKSRASDITHLATVAEAMLAPFIGESILKDALAAICRNAFNFAIPLQKLDASTSLLVLHHGPTAAFKDIGARFLAECIVRLDAVRNSNHDSKIRRTVIVATSGDTGGAVAGAFHKKPNIDVVILYPNGMISEFQEKQLTCWGDNVRAFAVDGTFDDCQRIVKEAFLDPKWKINNPEHAHLISANSINIGRILPQMSYYGSASLQIFEQYHTKPGFIVPTGNLGNALAAFWAQRLGFPIGKIALACNANQSIVEYFRTGRWDPHPTVGTLANAMDVGNPSNMERLLNLYPRIEDLKKDAESFSVGDEEIKSMIKHSSEKWGQVFCPHTATAAFVRTKLDNSQWVIVSTAHAAKFRTVVQPLVKKTFASPKSLELFESRKVTRHKIRASLTSLSEALKS